MKPRGAALKRAARAPRAFPNLFCRPCRASTRAKPAPQRARRPHSAVRAYISKRKAPRHASRDGQGALAACVRRRLATRSRHRASARSETGRPASPPARAHLAPAGRRRACAHGPRRGVGFATAACPASRSCVARAPASSTWLAPCVAPPLTACTQVSTCPRAGTRASPNERRSAEGGMRPRRRPGDLKWYSAGALSIPACIITPCPESTLERRQTGVSFRVATSAPTLYLLSRISRHPLFHPPSPFP